MSEAAPAPELHERIRKVHIRKVRNLHAHTCVPAAFLLAVVAVTSRSECIGLIKSSSQVLRAVDRSPETNASVICRANRISSGHASGLRSAISQACRAERDVWVGQCCELIEL